VRRNGSENKKERRKEAEETCDVVMRQDTGRRRTLNGVEWQKSRRREESGTAGPALLQKCSNRLDPSSGVQFLFFCFCFVFVSFLSFFVFLLLFSELVICCVGRTMLATTNLVPMVFAFAFPLL